MTMCWSIHPAAGSAPSSRVPIAAGGPARGAIGELARLQAQILARRRQRPRRQEERSSTRSARSPARRARPWWTGSWRAPGVPRRGPAGGVSAVAPPEPTARTFSCMPAPRRHRRILPRQAAARGEIPAAVVNLRSVVTDPPIKLGPECPSCGEPWLRPTAVPGRYRCVYCLQRYELVSVCPNCGEHSTIVRMSSTAIVACNHCQGSMLRAV